MPDKKIPQHLDAETVYLPVDPTESTPNEPQTANDLFATFQGEDANSASKGPKIPGFEILSELGRGAFGVVYRARDVKLDRLVAIKISLIDDPRLREQYIKEAQNAAKLDNSRIVPVYQVGTMEDGRPFVVQRLIDGCTLAKKLADKGPFDIRETCELMIEIARAVADAHANGIIHRDLKPENILVDATDKPWLADFGLALFEQDQRDHRGERAGTPTYMSPEQLQGRADWLDGRSDIYALGIMLYEMLAGRTPFDAKNFAELEEQVLHRDPKPISQRLPNIPPAVDLIFQNCCEKKVCDRYSNAYELVADLEAVMGEIGSTSSKFTSRGKSQSFSVVSRKTMHRVSVSTRNQSMRATLRELTSSKKLSRFAVPLAVLLSLGGVLALWPIAVGIRRISRDSASSMASVSPLVAEPNPGPDSGNSPRPLRPFRVSRDGAGTHTSIHSAIAMADKGETITILPGVYLEALSIDRNISLVGEGNREEIFIVGKDIAAVTIKGEVEVSLTNLTLEGSTSSEQQFNTVDMFGGTLTLNDCNLNSRSYDCVKTRPGCGLKAKDCRFRTASHPAISATQAPLLEVVGCDFEINPLSLKDKSAAGIEVIQGAGLVKGCHFAGAGLAVGIHWSDAQGQVNIEDAEFKNCFVGMYLKDCRDVRIQGTAPTIISGCTNGILLSDCNARLERIEIESSEADKGIYILAAGEIPAVPSVHLIDCKLSGFKESLAIKHAHVAVQDLRSTSCEEYGVKLGELSRLEIRESHISKSEIAGILVQDSSATLIKCVVSNNSFGVHVDGAKNALNCDVCKFENNVAGVVICSGSAMIRGSEFQGNSAGLLVTTREQLTPNELDGTKAPSFPIYLDLEDVTIRNSLTSSLQIRTPCSFRLSDGVLSEPFKLVGDLVAEKNGEITLVKIEGE